MERVIRVSGSGMGGHPKKTEQVVMKTDDKSGNLFTMQHQMEEELEKRRKDWEKEVEKMQEDFFNVKLPPKSSNNNINLNKTIEVEGPPSGMSPSSRKASKGMGILEIGNAKTIYTEAKNGDTMIKWNFDVRGFDPSCITVRAEGTKLTVSAEYEEETNPGSKNTRRHNRQVDIPSGVDTDGLVSRLSADGILTVEAPVNETEETEDDVDVTDIHVLGNSHLHGLQPSLGFTSEHIRSPTSTVTYNSYSPRTERVVTKTSTSSGGGRKRHERPDIVRNRTEVNDPHTINIYRVSGGDPNNDHDLYKTLSSEHKSPLLSKQFDYGDPNVVTTEEGSRLKIAVTLGTVYKPEEITVELLHRKIIVKAVHEEVVAGRSSKSEFSREFDIPGPVEPRTFKAVFSSEGKLAIGGSLAENKNHDAVMSLVYCDMPIKGRAVKVISH